MSIDLLPFSAFALESFASPERAGAEGQTLTSSSLATGSMLLRATELAIQAGERVSVIATEHEPLTITF